MTVSTTTSGVTRTGDGVTLEFSFSFEARLAAEIFVSEIVGLVLVAVDPADYVVAVAPNGVGGTVTFTVAPINGTNLYIFRETAQTQLVSVSNQTRYNPEVVEGVWDKHAFLIQELTELANRSVKTVPGGDPEALIETLETSAASAEADAAAAAASAAAAALFDPGNLAGLLALTLAANKLAYPTGASTWALTDFTAAARALLDDADAAAMRTTLGLGAMATKANVGISDLDPALFVTSGETIAANLNDTTVPTSAAVAADRKFTWATVGNLLIGPSQDVAIPTGVTEIVVNVPIGVSLSGTDDFILRLGDSGGVKATGYTGQSVLSATSTVSLSTDFRVPLGLASRAWAGHMRLHRDSALGWRWAFFGSVTGSLIASGAGEIGLSSELTTLRFTRSGTDTFDAGTSLRVGYR